MQIRPFKESDEDAVIDLWDRCGLIRPGNDPHRDIARKMTELGCPKINIQIRRDNLGVIAFYERIGFRKNDVVSFGRRLEQDDL